jgi:hypothetical protein
LTFQNRLGALAPSFFQRLAQAENNL